MYITKIKDDVWAICSNKKDDYKGPAYFSTLRSAIQFLSVLQMCGGDPTLATDIQAISFVRKFLVDGDIYLVYETL